MEYIGRLFGKIGRKYFDTGKTSEDWDKLEVSKIDGKILLEDVLKEGKEVIGTNGLRFNGTSEEKIKQVFEKHGIEYKNPF